MTDKQVFIPKSKPRTERETLERRLKVLYTYLSRKRRKVSQEELNFAMKLKNERNVGAWIDRLLEVLRVKKILKLGKDNEYYISSRYIGPSGFNMPWGKFLKRVSEETLGGDNLEGRSDVYENNG